MKRGKIWACKIGFADGRRLPRAADGPMREADFCFSGWGAELTDAERRVIEPPQ
jgi:hypothetical protein